jgi:glycosyltransferase involved in cell wall biosynthesis
MMIPEAGPPDGGITETRILYVSYPLLTVSSSSAGGAEQVLWTLEREMHARGAHTTVAASGGSNVSGKLFSTGEPCHRPDDFERRNREHQDKIIDLVHRSAKSPDAFDLIHDMSGSFWTRAAELEMPVLATLHLPRHFYSEDYFQNLAPNVSFNSVSQSQARSFAHLPQMIGVVPNGIALEKFSPHLGPREGLLWLGRVCEEKGPHLALDIAANAGMAITIAGKVYPFSYHQQFFEREIQPRLRANPKALWIDSPSQELKCELLRRATALLGASLVDETSSLVAMEAAACGTPVIAFRRGALPEVVKHGVTGFLVKDIADAARALARLTEISSLECIQHARKNFSASAMADGYEQLYAALLSRRPQRVLNTA